jgi:hypothetical protein
VAVGGRTATRFYLAWSIVTWVKSHTMVGQDVAGGIADLVPQLFGHYGGIDEPACVPAGLVQTKLPSEQHSAIGCPMLAQSGTVSQSV